MSLDELKAALPDYAKDIRLNLGAVVNSTALSERQVWGAALAAAVAVRNPDVRRAFEAEAKSRLTPEEITAAKTAASIMAMNNVYYRFLHLLEKEEYRKAPARLRMNVIANPGVDKLDFELWSLTVSAINGCGLCVQAHEREILAKGASSEAVQDAVRIAAVVHAAAVTLEAEEDERLSAAA